METIEHPRFARYYDRLSRRLDALGATAHRDEILAGLEGRVLELGAGNGLNFGRYPATVRQVLAVEPEPNLRALAERAAADAPVPVRVIAGIADALPVEDAAVDAAVASLVLCSVPDQDRALAELFRVIRPGGQLRFYEHVRAGTTPLRSLQRAVDLVWPAIGGGCHLGRDTGTAIARAGFVIVSARDFRFLPSPWMLPGAPHLIGTARRP